MPLQATSGAASYDAFGGGAAAVPTFVEDVFSTYLYTGNGTTQTITNNIDLSGKGGLVWIKRRNLGGSHNLIDTVRGQDKILFSDFNFGESTSTPGTGLTSFTSSGFELGPSYVNFTNTSGSSLASWTFRKQPKFFDVVTWSGNTSSSNRRITHNLQATPAVIIIKNTSLSDSWYVYTASTGTNGLLFLETTDAVSTGGNPWSTVAPTSTDFGYNENAIGNSGNWVAYLFASNAGGFGLTGTDNVISCGGYTGNGSFTGTVVNLGFEPQWLMIKRTNDLADWFIFDNMRGVATAATTATGYDAKLVANGSAAENSGTDFVSFTSTGFQLANDSSSVNANGSTYIYIAIRRGPMKVPTSGTSVFAPQATRDATDGTATQLAWTAGFPVDALWNGSRNGGGQSVGDRLRGGTQNLIFSSTDAEGSGSSRKFDSNSGVYLSSATGASSNQCGWMFRRAPSFFDEVCYTGNGAGGQNIANNLNSYYGLILIKRRNGTSNWFCWHRGTSTASGEDAYNQFSLNSTSAANLGPTYMGTSPNIAYVTDSAGNIPNDSGATYVAYFFGASVAGVSMTGLYTGTGALQTVNCGFTSGARFVLIKRVDSTGDWWTYDSARGISSGNDPYLFLNSTAAEVTSTNYIDTDSTGFKVTDAAPAGLNDSGGKYIYLAIA
jgi:hypothetical protein